MNRPDDALQVIHLSVDLRLAVVEKQVDTNEHAIAAQLDGVQPYVCSPVGVSNCKLIKQSGGELVDQIISQGDGHRGVPGLERRLVLHIEETSYGAVRLQSSRAFKCNL